MDITLNASVMPESAHSSHKVAQVEALNVVWSTAIQGDKGGQVQASLASSGVFSGVTGNHMSTFVLPAASSGFENFNQDPSRQNLTEDEINTFYNCGITIPPPVPPMSQTVTVNNYCLQAEQAYIHCSAQKG